MKRIAFVLAMILAVPVAAQETVTIEEVAKHLLTAYTAGVKADGTPWVCDAAYTLELEPYAPILAALSHRIPMAEYREMIQGLPTDTPKLKRQAIQYYRAFLWHRGFMDLVADYDDTIADILYRTGYVPAFTPDGLPDPLLDPNGGTEGPTPIIYADTGNPNPPPETRGRCDGVADPKDSLCYCFEVKRDPDTGDFLGECEETRKNCNHCVDLKPQGPPGPVVDNRKN